MRPIEIINIEQGTDEWLAARAGRVTGSNASAVMAGEKTAARRDYILQLAVERLTGAPQLDDYTNKHIKHGSETEPLARIAVEDEYGITVRETGFIKHLELPIGVSLDGDWGDLKWILELKCPKSATHIDYMEANRLPAVYRWQVVHGLYVTGAEGAIFASYDPRVPEGLELFSLKVKAQDLPLEEYDLALRAFLKEVDEKYESLTNLQKKRKGEKHVQR